MGDGLSERRPLLRVAQGRLERGLRQAHRDRGGAEARERERLPPAADRATEKIARRNAAVVEVDPAGVEAPQSEHRKGWVDADAGQRGVDEEANGALSRPGLHQ